MGIEEKIFTDQEYLDRYGFPRPKCNYRKCFAGMGVAGNGSCFLGGDPQNPNCPEFEDEDEACRKRIDCPL